MRVWRLWSVVGGLGLLGDLGLVGMFQYSASVCFLFYVCSGCRGFKVPGVLKDSRVVVAVI